MFRIGNKTMKSLDLIIAARRRLQLLGNSRKHVCYIGWLGHGNLGDEAIFKGLQSISKHSNFEQFSGDKIEKLLAKFKLSGSSFFSSALLGGGTLINPKFLHSVKTMLDTKVPISALGTGVGSTGFGDDYFVNIDEWKEPLSQFQYIGVRGPLSLSALNTLGIQNVEIIGDLGLSLAKQDVIKCNNSRSFAINVTFPLVALREKPPPRYLATLVAVIKDLSKDGWRPVPIAMSVKDVKPIQELLFRAHGKKVHVPIAYHHDNFFELIKPCKFAITVRLHAAVLSCCAGVPPLVIGYREKCSDFMASLQLEEWCLDLFSAELKDINAALHKLIDSTPTLREEILQKANYWRDKQVRCVRDVLSF